MRLLAFEKVSINDLADNSSAEPDREREEDGDGAGSASETGVIEISLWRRVMSDEDRAGVLGVVISGWAGAVARIGGCSVWRDSLGVGDTFV